MAQEHIFFEHIGRKEGLPQVSVNAIVQDELGFMWFGTQEGLTRFDGYDFQTFKHDVNDPGSLGDNSVWCILCSNDGTMWVGTNEGLSRFNPNTKTFINHRFDPGAPESMSDLNVRALLLDSQGMLWVGTRNGGLNCCKPSGDGRLIFQRYTHDENDGKSIGSNYICDLYEDDQGRLWVATIGGGLNRLDLKHKENGFTRFTFDPGNPESISSSNVLCLYESRHKGLLVGTEKGLNRLKNDGNGFERFLNDPQDENSLGHNAVSCMTQDPDGGLWIGTNGGGLDRLDENGRFHHFPSKSEMEYGLSGNDVRSLFFDRQGLLWIGTYGNGLNKMDRTTRAFSLLRHDSRDDKTLSDNIVLSILEDRRGTLWVGTWGAGVNRLQDRKTVDRHFFHDPCNMDGLSSNTIWAMLEDLKGNLWFGTWKGGLNRLPASERPKENPKFLHYRHDANKPDSLANDSILCLFEDSRGILWIGTWGGGLNRVTPDCSGNRKIRFEKYLHDPRDNQSIGDNFIKTIMEDRAGNIWVGTWGGGISLLSATAIKNGEKKFIRYQKEWNTPNALSHNDVLSIYEDREGIFWIGTYGGGLNRFDPKTGQFKAYTENNGLSNNAVYGIVPDDRGALWLSTNFGINRFDPKTEIFVNYDARDGLQGDEFNQEAYLKGRNGNIYFGGVMGLTIFNPDNLIENEFIPPVYLTDFQLFHQSIPISKSGILTQSIETTQSITLNYREATFGMVFSALNYRQSDKNRFAYILEGIDKEWIETDHEMRMASYTKVDPGTYTFRVKASNDDVKWNNEGASLEIKILGPWWALWWVRAIAIVLFICILWAIHQASVHFLRKQKVSLEKMVRKRTMDIVRQKEQIAHKNRSLAEKNTLLEQQTQLLENLSKHDPLTNLFNRRGFQEISNAEQIRANRKNKPFSFLLGDIDFFKKINDRYGHDVGDEVLVAVANEIQNTVRAMDTVGRWGGEEFIVLLPEINQEEAGHIAERIRKNIEGLRIKSNTESLNVTMSIGVSCCEQNRNIDACIKIADNALYKGKKGGRNRVEIGG